MNQWIIDFYILEILTLLFIQSYTDIWGVLETCGDTGEKNPHHFKLHNHWHANWLSFLNSRTYAENKLVGCWGSALKRVRLGHQNIQDHHLVEQHKLTRPQAEKKTEKPTGWLTSITLTDAFLVLFLFFYFNSNISSCWLLPWIRRPLSKWDLIMSAVHKLAHIKIILMICNAIGRKLMSI